MVTVANHLQETGSYTREIPRPWSTGELKRLRELAGTDLEIIADELGRSVRSIQQAAYRARISLRRPGSRTGPVMGQPRGSSWADARRAAAELTALRKIREGVLAGTIDPARLEEEVRRATAIARGAPPCPRCVQRPQEVKRTGLCRDCHDREMARAHATETARRAARREYWREKRRAHRRRAAEDDDVLEE